MSTAELEKPKIETPAAAAPAPTEAELEASRKDFMAGMGFGDPAAEKETKAKSKEEDKKKLNPTEEPKKEEKAETLENPAELEKKDEPKEPKKPKKKSELTPKEPEQKKDTIDEDALADRLAERIKNKPPEPEPTLDDPELSHEDRATLSALERLAKEPKYAGRDLVKETKAFWKRETEYATAWETQHPGEEFQGGDPEHKAFYARYQPKYVPADLETAREHVKEEAIQKRIEESVNKRVEPELEQLRAREEFRRAQPEIDRATESVVTELVAAAVPEFKEIISDKDGNMAITQAALDKMTEVNPEAVELLNEKVIGLKHVINELEKLTRLGKYYKLNRDMKTKLATGEEIKPHQAIVDVSEELEELIQKQPKADQMVDGRPFISLDELAQRQIAVLNSRDNYDAKMAKLEGINTRFWHVEPPHLRERLVNKTAAEVSKILKFSEKRTERIQSKLAKVAETAKNGKHAEAKLAKPQQPAPAITATSDNVDTSKPTEAAEEENRREFASAFFE